MRPFLCIKHHPRPWATQNCISSTLIFTFSHFLPTSSLSETPLLPSKPCLISPQQGMISPFENPLPSSFPIELGVSFIMCLILGILCSPPLSGLSGQWSLRCCAQRYALSLLALVSIELSKGVIANRTFFLPCHLRFEI